MDIKGVDTPRATVIRPVIVKPVVKHDVIVISGGKRPLKSELLQRQDERTEQAKAQDSAKANKTIIEVRNPRTRSWMKNPGSMDVLRIDTPRGITRATSFPKPKVHKAPAPKARRHYRGPRKGLISHYKGR